MANDKDSKKKEDRPEEEKKKRRPRSKKSSSGGGGIGGLPSKKDMAKTASESDSGVARSMGGAAVAPASQMLGGLPAGFGPSLAPAASAPPSFAGAKMDASAFAGRNKSSGPRGTAAPVESYEHDGWKFRDAPTLPEQHPLERTAVFVPRSDAADVARRVSETLRSRSIAASYDDGKAKASCTTDEGVEFRVRLYRGRNKFSHGVIVEVQRRFGFSVRFHEDCRAVLDAAEGKAAPPAPPAKALPKFLPPVVVSDLEDDDDDDFDDGFDAPSPFSAPPPPSAGLKRASASSGLDVAANVLKRRRSVSGGAKEEPAGLLDSLKIALGVLASSTSAECVGKAAAVRASRRILADDDGEEDTVRDAVISLLVDRALDLPGQTLEDDDAGVEELRLQAMTVLCNSVETLARHSPSALKERSIFLADDILPVVLEELRDARKNVRMAALAARCLKALLDTKAVRQDVVRAARDANADQALRTANEAGQRNHANLEETTQRCIEMIVSR